MPIRLNLLAEAQATEDMRRRDPAKRVIWVAAVLISVMLLWSLSLFLKSMLANKSLNAIQTQMNTRTNQYQHVQDGQKKAADIKARLAALNQLATNRFLNGTLLNALQQTTSDDVQLFHLKVEQTYVLHEETKARTNATSTLPPKPGSATEKIVITLEGNDASQSGDQYDKFKDALASNPYFQGALSKTNGIILKGFLPASASADPLKRSVHFTLECRYAEKTR